MTDKEAMKLALFALDIVKIHYTQSRHVNEAIAALKERLAQEKALQALHDENDRLGLYKDAYVEQEPLIGCVNHDCAKCKENT
jgi:5-bromo-4-chloroindolyl phosphate hydrolysis protein